MKGNCRGKEKGEERRGGGGGGGERGKTIEIRKWNNWKLKKNWNGY